MSATASSTRASATAAPAGADVVFPLGACAAMPSYRPTHNAAAWRSSANWLRLPAGVRTAIDNLIINPRAPAPIRGCVVYPFTTVGKDNAPLRDVALLCSSGTLVIHSDLVDDVRARGTAALGASVSACDPGCSGPPGDAAFQGLPAGLRINEVVAAADADPRTGAVIGCFNDNPAACVTLNRPDSSIVGPIACTGRVTVASAAGSGKNGSSPASPTGAGTAATTGASVPDDDSSSDLTASRTWLIVGPVLGALALLALCIAALLLLRRRRNRKRRYDRRQEMVGRARKVPSRDHLVLAPGSTFARTSPTGASAPSGWAGPCETPVPSPLAATSAIIRAGSPASPGSVAHLYTVRDGATSDASLGPLLATTAAAASPDVARRTTHRAMTASPTSSTGTGTSGTLLPGKGLYFASSSTASCDSAATPCDTPVNGTAPASPWVTSWSNDGSSLMAPSKHARAADVSPAVRHGKKTDSATASLATASTTTAAPQYAISFRSTPSASSSAAAALGQHTLPMNDHEDGGAEVASISRERLASGSALSLPIHGVVAPSDASLRAGDGNMSPRPHLDALEPARELGAAKARKRPSHDSLLIPPGSEESMYLVPAALRESEVSLSLDTRVAAPALVTPATMPRASTESSGALRVVAGAVHGLRRSLSGSKYRAAAAAAAATTSRTQRDVPAHQHHEYGSTTPVASLALSLTRAGSQRRPKPAPLDLAGCSVTLSSFGLRPTATAARRKHHHPAPAHTANHAMATNEEDDLASVFPSYSSPDADPEVALAGVLDDWYAMFVDLSTVAAHAVAVSNSSTAAPEPLTPTDPTASPVMASASLHAVDGLASARRHRAQVLHQLTGLLRKFLDAVVHPALFVVSRDGSRAAPKPKHLAHLFADIAAVARDVRARDVMRPAGMHAVAAASSSPALAPGALGGHPPQQYARDDPVAALALVARVGAAQFRQDLSRVFPAAFASGGIDWDEFLWTQAVRWYRIKAARAYAALVVPQAGCPVRDALMIVVGGPSVHDTTGMKGGGAKGGGSGAATAEVAWTVFPGLVDLTGHRVIAQARVYVA
ncbi:hypothetical protein H9P43_003727 [Blastocladiella emersonii ATCC 22665]|nr:hypothetical protein H9P43_003727 [Blastocladiella emersonii ATCC 22665]